MIPTWLYWTLLIWGMGGTLLVIATPSACKMTGDKQPTTFELLLGATLWPFLVTSIAIRHWWNNGLKQYWGAFRRAMADMWFITAMAFLALVTIVLISGSPT